MAKRDSPGRPQKVPKIIEEYDLEDMGDQLEARWTGQDGPTQSLRFLTDWVNRKILQRAMEESGLDPLPEEVELVYEKLTDDDASRGQRIHVRRRLERSGIEVESVLSDFVSRQAVHTFLTKERDVEKPSKEGDPVTRDAEIVRKLVSRTETVTKEKLSILRESEEITLGEFRSSVDISVHCLDCNSQFSFDDLLREGGCDCT